VEAAYALINPLDFTECFAFSKFEIGESIFGKSIF
jgi:hypothetical protein